MGGDTLIAAAKDGVYSVVALNSRTARTGDALVAVHSGVTEVVS